MNVMEEVLEFILLKKILNINLLIVLNYYKKKNVYIIGNGWSGYYFSKYLDKKKYNAKIIAPNENVLNTPKLINYLTDDTSKIDFQNNYIEKITDVVLNIDNKNNQIYTKNNSYKYDYVIFCIGSEYNDFGIKGVENYAYKLKNKNDIIRLKEKLKDQNIKNVCIIGSGATGIELALKLKKYNYNIKIIEGLNDILPGFNNISKRKIKNLLKEEKIDLCVNNFVSKITNNKIYTETKIKAKTITNEFNYDLVIWTGGIKFNGYQRTFLFNTLNKINKITPRGINVDNDFSINKNKNIYCLGDIVANKGPPTAQNAKYQAIWLANYFNKDFNEELIKEIRYKDKSKGKLLHLDDKIYLESKFYNGYIPKYIHSIIDYFI